MLFFHANCAQIDQYCHQMHLGCHRMVTCCTHMDVCIFLVFTQFFTFLTAVNNIHLTLYGDFHVQQALLMVAAEEEYTEVLQLEFKPREEGDNQPPQLQAAGKNAVLEAAIIKAQEKHVKGDLPPNFPEQSNYSTHTSTSLCLDNQEQYSRISHYMNLRGGFDCVPVAPDGSCMFSSLRGLISAPFKYRNIHLLRQLFFWLITRNSSFNC